MTPYPKMLQSLLVYTYVYGRVHNSGVYPASAIEHIVQASAGVALHESPALLGLEIGAMLPPDVKELAQAEAQFFEVFVGLFRNMLYGSCLMRNKTRTPAGWWDSD